MKRKNFISAIVIASLLSPLSWAYTGGSGTQDDPYRIATVADWLQLMSTSGDWNKHFILTADLDLHGLTLTPVGSYARCFSGVFDGQGFTLRNALIDLPGSDCVGLFGFLGDGGHIRDLGAEDVNVTGLDCVGGLVGANGDWGSPGGTLTSCYATGQVTGDDYVGGLVGRNCGTLTSCYATGHVTGDLHVGGLVGENWDGTLTSCYAAGQVTGGSRVGGLVGKNDRGTLTACYAAGQVTGVGTIGGLVGKNDRGTLTACYAAGQVTGDGLCVGGLEGEGGGRVWSCFWDMQTSGQAGSAGGKGLTTEQMKTMHIFQNAGWGNYGWTMADGLDYPRLAWENTDGIPIPAPEPVPLAGSGTPENPYEVATPADFALLSWYISVLDKHIVLRTDLDLTCVQLYPIGHLGAFTGVFDGQGFTLRKAVIYLPESWYVGLFASLGEGGAIRDLGVEDVNITGDDYVGGLVGENFGMLTACYATGQVTGGWDVGGLVGHHYNGMVTACYATGQVTGYRIVGGLVGRNVAGVLTSCYAAGQATGEVSIGGLVGYNGRGTLTSCYATAHVTGDVLVGGLVGWNEEGTLTSSYATGQVSGRYDYVGGLVGDNWHGTLSSCYATGQVTGGGYVGGLVGDNWDGKLTSCYATGQVTGDERVGGLAGANVEGTLKSCYATGQVTGERFVGGLVGYKWNGMVTACFWDTQTSGWSYSVGGQGRTTAQMQDINTFLDAGWDFVGENENGTEDFWKMIHPGEDYPRLSWQVEYPPDIAGLYGVDFVDFAAFSLAWLSDSTPTGSWNPACDISEPPDGIIDELDLAVFCENWLAGR